MAITTSKSYCSWVPIADEMYVAYHDYEWGVPAHDDQRLFEMLCLEGGQAGLSWITILRRRQSYRQAFDNFDPQKMALYDEAKRSELLQDAGIIRNRLKVSAFIDNAKAYLAIKDAGQSFDEYLWSFSHGAVFKNELYEIKLAVAEAMSKDLKKRGFRFVGPTICYAFMQACGIIDDHDAGCWKHKV